MATAYSVTMAVLSSMPTEFFLVDASGPVLAGVSFVFGAVVAGMWVVAWRLIGKKETAEARDAEMRRNAVVLFAGSAVLAAVFLSLLVVSILYLVVDYERFFWARFGLQTTGHVLTIVAVLSYIGVAVGGAVRGGLRKNQKQHEANGIGSGESNIPLLGGEEEVPERYKDF